MYRIGVDLGGTNIAAGIVNDEYKIVYKDSVPTGADRDPDMIVADMAALCHRLCEKSGIAISEIESVGIASPGIANSRDGVVEYSCNLPFVRYPICDKLQEKFNVAHIFVENDANAAAWGEAIAGAAKGTHSSVMVTLGTGVGGGIIIDDKLVSGFNFAGAEIGHVVLVKDGAACGCGRRGCWEAYSSATALIRMTAEKIEECEKSGRYTVMSDYVKEYGKVSGRTAFDGHRAGDAASIEVVDMYVDYLADGLANMINIFQPEVVSIGGGVSNEGQYILDMLVPLVNSRIYGAGIVEGPEIKIAQLKNDAGIVGGAVLGLK